MIQPAKEIVVALNLHGGPDNETEADKLIAFGAGLASLLGSQIRLFHSAGSTDGISRLEMEKQLHRFARDASSQCRSTVWIGSSINELFRLKRAHVVSTELIVASLREHRDRSFQLWGSTSENLVRHIRRPIALLGPSCECVKPRRAEDHSVSILLATDLKRQSRSAEWYALSLAKRTKGKITIFHSLLPAVQPQEEGVALRQVVSSVRKVNVEDAKLSAEKSLRELQDMFRRRGVDSDLLMNSSRESLDRMLSSQDVTKYSFVVIGEAQKSGKMTGTLLGNTALELGLKARIPVVAVRCGSFQ